MNNPYQILGCKPTSTHQEVRTAYLNLSRRYHPDKSNNTAMEFQNIQLAWKEIKRLESIKHPPPQIVNIDEMMFINEESLFIYRCRCGDEILARSEELELGINTYPCLSCSLWIHILYEIEKE